MPRRLQRLVILLFFILAAFGVGTAQNLPPVVKAELAKKKSYKTMRADIYQRVMETGKAGETFRGKYMVDARGRIRVDYVDPEPQSIVYDTKEMFWVYYNRRFAWRIPRKLAGSMLPAKPGGSQDFAPAMWDKIGYVYKGRSGGRYHTLEVFPKPTTTLTKVKVLFDNDWNLAKRILLDDDGRPFFNEEFADYKKLGEVFVPRQVVVTLKRAGKIIVNETEYSNIQVDVKIPESYFKFRKPAGFTIREYALP